MENTLNINGAKIIVTGGLGFIGSNFISYLQHHYDVQIVNIDKESYASNLDISADFEKRGAYKFIKADIADETSTSNIINSEKPDAIINFAAESHVDRSIDGAKPFIYSNIIGTFNLLETFRNYYDTSSSIAQQNMRFIHVSTDEVYGSLEDVGFFTEESKYDPSSPYSASKAASDHLVKAWHKTYNLPVLITNCSNNYGPLQYGEKLIPKIIYCCLNSLPIPVYGNGTNVRDWIHVEDHVKGILTVLNKGRVGQQYNIGSMNEWQNIDIVNYICKIFDDIDPRNDNSKYADLISFVEDRKGHDFRYAIDINKIKDELEWEPEIDFNHGLRSTVEWYIEHQHFFSTNK